MPETGQEALRQAHALLAERTSADRSAHGEDPERPETVQAMQIALRIPKADPPKRTDLLEASARAVVMVCLDEQAGMPGEWQDGLTAWYDHLIRKVARRGRNKAWDDVQSLPGITADVDGSQARAFVPSAVSEVPAELKKLQIRGTDLPQDDPAPIDPSYPAIAIDAGLEMSTGKAAAQVGHASMLLAASQDFSWILDWAEDGYPLQVREVSAERMAELVETPGVVTVHDAGFTEVAPDSLTVLALPGQRPQD